MTDENPVWRVVINDTEHGPLSKMEVLRALRDGRLVGSDQIWRPGFSEWMLIQEIGELWQPPARQLSANVISAQSSRSLDDKLVVSSERSGGIPSGTKWSLWKSANFGVLLSAVSLAAQIGSGRGFELASYAYTASSSTISNLVGQILAAPLFLVLAAVIRNLFFRRQTGSSANVPLCALIFIALLAAIAGGLMAYGQIVFSSNEIISGRARKTFVSGMVESCRQKQNEINPNLTAVNIESYCTCVGQKIADVTSYKQLGTEPNAIGLTELKQKVDAAAAACHQ